MAIKETPDPAVLDEELRDIAQALGECLARLDEVGAGIAAIHVNAALEHLRTLGQDEEPGLSRAGGEAGHDWSLGEDRIASIDARLLCILPATGRAH